MTNKRKNIFSQGSQGKLTNKYIINANSSIKIDEKLELPRRKIVEAVNLANERIGKIYKTSVEMGINIFDTLGLRNLSGFVGEIFSQSVIDTFEDKFIKNPHQDGYPDVLRIDSKETLEWFENGIERKNGKIYPKSKEYFSGYKFGAFEVKATCGNTPSAKKVAKPLVGEERVDLLESFEWKAHHRETDKMLSILWDFIEEKPTIIAVFYRDDLEVEDWGKIVQPKEENGGRTTSVSIMKQSGVKKMTKNWVTMLDQDKYIKKLEKWTTFKKNLTH